MLDSLRVRMREVRVDVVLTDPLKFEDLCNDLHLKYFLQNNLRKVSLVAT